MPREKSMDQRPEEGRLGSAWYFSTQSADESTHAGRNPFPRPLVLVFSAPQQTRRRWLSAENTGNRMSPHPPDSRLGLGPTQPVKPRRIQTERARAGGETDHEGRVFCFPAIAHGKISVRSAGRHFCVGLKSQAKSASESQSRKQASVCAVCSRIVSRRKGAFSSLWCLQFCLIAAAFQPLAAQHYRVYSKDAGAGTLGKSGFAFSPCPLV
ncbi:uncharacterized protein LOC120388073 isoform X3 [Mauremys reevesii]|nr:uncharacterized protein LOC120388073 isoform X3 [Mauremys reevesii]